MLKLVQAARARGPLLELLASLLFYNALRVSEALGADVADVRQHQGLHVLVVRGKGETEKNVRVPLNHETMRWIGTCPCAPRRSPAARTSRRLLVSPHSPRSPMRQAAYGRVARLADTAGVGPEPHGLRATLITVALRRGIASRNACGTATPRIRGRDHDATAARLGDAPRVETRHDLPCVSEHRS